MLREVGDEAIVLGTVQAGEFVGEMGVLEGRTRSATVRAAAPVEAELIERQAFLERVSLEPELARKLLLRMSARLRDVEDTLTQLYAGRGAEHGGRRSGAGRGCAAGRSAAIAHARRRDLRRKSSSAPSRSGSRICRSRSAASTTSTSRLRHRARSRDPDDEPHRLSRAHFSLIRDDRDILVRDLNSTLGTIVNGRPLGRDFPVDSAPLRKGDNSVVAGGDGSPFAFDRDPRLTARSGALAMRRLAGCFRVALAAIDCAVGIEARRRGPALLQCRPRPDVGLRPVVRRLHGGPVPCRVLRHLVGAGIIAGGPYGCAEGQLATALNRCMQTHIGPPDAVHLLQRAEELARQGAIDPIAGLRGIASTSSPAAKMRTVTPAVVDQRSSSTARRACPRRTSNMSTMSPAGHAFITGAMARPAPATASPYINDCDYDQAGALLNHIYGGLNPPAAEPGGAMHRVRPGRFLRRSHARTASAQRLRLRAAVLRAAAPPAASTSRFTAASRRMS